VAVTVRVPPSIWRLAQPEVRVEPAPPDLGALIRELERRHPGLGTALDSSAVNAAVNGEVILHGRDAAPLKDGDAVEFLVMFAGG
jgi:molybdopterin converting factor small subunit